MKKQKQQGIHAVEVFGREVGQWVWCSHCERAYQVGEYRSVRGLQMCPYEGCNGDTVLDARDWDEFQNTHLNCPEEPERDVVYSQFDE